MTDERRTAPRDRCVFDATWSGMSGNGSVRISDVSVTGCYVGSLATPRPGERIQLQAQLVQGPLALEGEVAYVEPRMGFGVRFVNVTPEAVEMLANAIARLK